MMNSFFWKTSSRVQPLNFDGPDGHVTEEGGPRLPARDEAASGDYNKLAVTTVDIHSIEYVDPPHISRRQQDYLVIDLPSLTFQPVTNRKERNPRAQGFWMNAVKKVHLKK